jgi:hypothetical protein
MERNRLLSLTGNSGLGLTNSDLRRLAGEDPSGFPHPPYAPVAPIVPSFTDDFNRIDGALGANWVQLNTVAAVIVNNQVTSSGVSNTGAARTVSKFAGENQWAEVTMVNLLGATKGVMVRVPEGAVNAPETGYYWRVSSGGLAQLFRFDNGIATALGAGVSVAFAPGDVYRITAIGSTIRGYINGVLIQTATDTTYLDGRCGGIRVTANTALLDNFRMGDLVGPVFRDNFNRVDGLLGANWAPLGPAATGLSVSGNAAGNTIAAATEHSRTVAQLPNGDGYAQVAVTNLAGPSKGVMIRVPSGLDGQINGYLLRYNDAGTTNLFSISNGAATPVGTVLSGALVAPFVLRLEAKGSTIKCYIDGVLKGTVTDTTWPNGPYCALRINDVTARLDDFEMGTL